MFAVAWLGAGRAGAQRATEVGLAALESEAEIRRLLDKYVRLLDARDRDRYELLFAEDGELEI